MQTVTIEHTREARHTGSALRDGIRPAGLIGDCDGGAGVWYCSTAAALAAPEALASLASDEIAHANRLRRPGDRYCYLAGRVLLRQLLSRAVGHEVAPAAWRFRIGTNGKPEVADGLPRIKFNLSHAGNCVAVAISPGGAIGVDLEELPTGAVDIVEDVLTAGERARLATLPEERRGIEFLRLWTVKEACAKALALTLDGLDALDVRLHPLSVAARGMPRLDVAASTVWCSGSAYSLSVARRCR